MPGATKPEFVMDGGVVPTVPAAHGRKIERVLVLVEQPERHLPCGRAHDGGSWLFAEETL
jgi:hypothetical protein